MFSEALKHCPVTCDTHSLKKINKIYLLTMSKKTWQASMVFSSSHT